MSQVQELFNELRSAFEEFKKNNDERLKQIEQNGKADPLLEQKVDKANDHVTELETKIQNAQKEAQERIDKLEMDMQQQGLGANGKPNNAELKSEARQFFNAVNGRPVEDSEVDLEAYSAYKQAFNKYLRLGNKALNSSDIRNALSVGSDPDGGQYVPAATSNRIITKLFETSPMRSIANVVTIGTDRLELPRDLDEATSGGWVGETESRSATATPQVGMKEVAVHEQYAMPEVTQKLLDDSQFDVEAWLADKIADILGRTENTAFVSGDGIMKPMGFLSYSSNTTDDSSRAWNTLQHVLSGTSSKTPDTPDELIELTGKLKSAYRSGAVWVMNRFVRSKLRKLSDSNTQYYLIPDLSQGGAGQLLGFPIVEFDDMDDEGSGNVVAAFGNFNTGYQIVDRQGIRVIRDNLTNKPYIRLYTTKRVGADLVHSEAIKLLKCTS